MEPNSSFTCSFKLVLILRAEKQQLHEKLNQGEKVEEVDDSGFYAGFIHISLIWTYFKSQYFVVTYPSFIFLTQCVSGTGGPVPVVGVTITMDDQRLNGTNRVVLDGVLSQSECDRVMQLATVSFLIIILKPSACFKISHLIMCWWFRLLHQWVMVIGGDALLTRRMRSLRVWLFSGHSRYNDTHLWNMLEWSIIYRFLLQKHMCLQLAQDGLVNQSDARLLHEIGETARVLMHSYFRSHSALYFSYTHLVCRSAIPGTYICAWVRSLSFTQLTLTLCGWMWLCV